MALIVQSTPNSHEIQRIVELMTYRGLLWYDDFRDHSKLVMTIFDFAVWREIPGEERRIKDQFGFIWIGGAAFDCYLESSKKPNDMKAMQELKKGGCFPTKDLPLKCMIEQVSELQKTIFESFSEEPGRLFRFEMSVRLCDLKDEVIIDNKWEAELNGSC
ncbi:MAG: hypothetical protein K9M07_04690 [Simkaniaceae bacterium]|nr:hypothetical protein [Simkaniaceae bacterium]